MIRTAPVLSETTFRGVVDRLRKAVSGIRAVVLLAPDGSVPAYFSDHPNFQVDVFASEYSTALRIAGSTTNDVGSGELIEYITVSGPTITVVRRLQSGSFLILTSENQGQIGRARYEIKRAALFLDQHLA